MALVVFIVFPVLERTLGGNEFLWTSLSLLVVVLAWIIYRLTISPPREWRKTALSENGSGTLVMVRESASRRPGVGVISAKPEGVQIDFPDGEELLIGWSSIASVRTAAEEIGGKWKLEIETGQPSDLLILYPLADDGVSMRIGASAVQALLASIEAMRPPDEQ